MVKFLLLSCIVFAFALVHSNGTANHRSSPSPVQAPHLSKQKEAESCDVLMFKMIHCLPYLSKTSKLGDPDDSCCSGFMEVWRSDSNCVCEALKDSVELGFQLNMTRAVYISCSCGFRHISIDKCLSNLSRKASPVLAATPSPALPLVQPPTKASAADSFLLSNFFLVFVSFSCVFYFLDLINTSSNHERRQDVAAMATTGGGGNDDGGGENSGDIYCGWMEIMEQN
ncbi:hypothetical protein OSB04_un001100 [Centaurea solstitialis]|uniref:Bifunctional inhibitor/plant lipid transfer protein/seed storage helical domain-containing protein n=1 Tax=Centaurea solstitialis TaxID=347529 RepID=A0AA38VR75_9ASTR|nr:hypothetical protein OSB04_un001100 [Centaurea solstitialis]